MNNFPIKPPPNAVVPLVHRICEFYKTIRGLSPKIPKKDRFGIFLKIENISLEILNLIIAASFENRGSKLPLLKSVRIKVEVLKRLFRIIHEIKIIPDKKYIEIESELQEISKMVSGWIKYLTNNV